MADGPGPAVGPKPVMAECNGEPISRRGWAENFVFKWLRTDANGCAPRKKRIATSQGLFSGDEFRDGDTGGHAGFSERRIEPGGKSLTRRGGDRGDTLEAAGAEGSRHPKCN